MAHSIRIGTSGYVYDHWRGCIYPEGLPPRRWLAWYAGYFDCVELNTTFYRLARPGNAAVWAATVPSGFRFAVKGSRFLTHMRKLLDREVGVQRFFDSIVGLGRRRGPVLWQLPARMKRDAARLDGFLSAMPRGKYAVEFRDMDWLHESVLDVLDRHGAALVMHDLLETKWPADPPGRFVYRRFHGATGAYRGCYSNAQLRVAARWIEQQTREAWVFFNNDEGGHAFRNALALKSLALGAPRPLQPSALQEDQRGSAFSF
jgi:uncharacterized protein YecE (DUF72 family)